MSLKHSRIKHARIQSVGHNTKETTWTAQDCKNRTAYGKTEAEARENLEKANKEKANK